jgi:enamine deaminase RidA (YjgF/YER057c/UK114 family)
MRTLEPTGWKRPKGYSNGIEAAGRLIFVAGQVGWDEEERIVAGGFAEQAEQALRNIVAVLAAGGARPEHLVRLTWFVTDKGEYLASQAAVGAAYRRVIGRHFPAMSVIEIKGLYEEGAKLEIEATAVVPPA